MVAEKTCEREHDFTLALTGIAELTPAMEDALFEAGCDDATISTRSGRVFLAFTRAAPTLKDAVLSAIRNVRDAGIGADVLRIDECNLVTQADIARRIDRSRQLVHQYIRGERGPGGFPSPVCQISDESSLWYWCEVAYWLRQHDMIKEHVLREAQEVAAINSVLELQQQKLVAPELVDEILQTVTSHQG